MDLGFVTVSSWHGWNSTPAELRIVTRAITGTSAVIRVRLREGISHVPVPVTHDPLSEACAHTHTHREPHTHFSAACTHVEPVSGHWARAGLSKMQRLWTEDLFTGRRKAGYHIARSGTHWCWCRSHCQMKPWIYLMYKRWFTGYLQIFWHTNSRFRFVKWAEICICAIK